MIIPGIGTPSDESGEDSKGSNTLFSEWILAITKYLFNLQIKYRTYNVAYSAIFLHVSITLKYLKNFLKTNEKHFLKFWPREEILWKKEDTHA